jgi:hypothetical protein
MKSLIGVPGVGIVACQIEGHGDTTTVILIYHDG